ncbi:hypothetical protein M5D96_001145 [Drosophila gunungcola]|uniref:Uncharacterized protein n=1 Tax=Drosophila gunungcola TaxID=103775 RepID=A0A9P9YY37_9MUSC|nr:hypothetical protein M5D96_001145 [Drosophila gunungcola]
MFPHGMSHCGVRFNKSGDDFEGDFDERRKPADFPHLKETSNSGPCVTKTGAAIGGSTRPPYGGGWRPLGPISPLSYDDNRATGQPVAVPFSVGAGTAVGTGVEQPRMPPAT